jgi:GH15 family glucan-1,4-alpha-glucosidase
MRPVVLSNQRLLVNLDNRGFVRDLYFKRVGQENHVLGVPHKIAVWAEHTLEWIDGSDWVVTMHADSSLCTTTTVRNEKRDITLTFTDIVLKDHDVFLRRITSNRHVRLFVYHYFFLYGDGIGDTAGFDPIRTIMFHYKRYRYFGIGAYSGSESVLADYTVGVPIEGQESWRDAEDGTLNKNPIAQGHVDSCVAFNVLEGQTVDYVICCARGFTPMRALVDEMKTADRSALVQATIDDDHAFSREPEAMHTLPEEWRKLYRQSLLLVRAHQDAGGAIVAGADSENMLFNRDTYTYAWGADNAIIACAMDRAGKHELTRKYFEFIRPLLEPEGFYMHKHHPDGSLGSSWQAWVRDGQPYLPIQEDETAMQLWALKVHHDKAGDDYVSGRYHDWIAKIIDFLLGHVRDDIALPKDSWDRWEERQGIHTWTVATVIAGLTAGAFFADLHDDVNRATNCRELAARMTDAMTTSLASSEHGRFIRRLTPDLHQDLTIDAADLAPFLFGVLPPEHPLVVGTVKAIEEHLATPDGGIARYQGDYFHRKTEDCAGNPWTFCALWIANWHITQAKESGDVHWQRANQLIEWVCAHAVGANLLGEQFHPHTGEPLAVCPLTWAHAQFIDTMHTYIEHKNK